MTIALEKFNTSQYIHVDAYIQCRTVPGKRNIAEIYFVQSMNGTKRIGLLSCYVRVQVRIGPAVRADFRRLYPANGKTPTCCPSDDNRTKVTNSVTSARSLWWHVGPYFWPADLTRTANPIAMRTHHRRQLDDIGSSHELLSLN